MKSSHNDQRGSAIFIILIATVLFAALAFVFMQGSRTSTGFLTEEQAKVQAQQLIGYGSDVKNAVRRLQLRNCTPETISFENNVDDRYVNVNDSPENCKVFSNQGGGLSWARFATGPNEATLAFTATNRVNGVLTSARDLTMIYGPLEMSVCVQINKSLDFASNNDFIATDKDWFSLEPFTGVYPGSGGPLLGSDDDSTAGKLSGCMKSTTTSGPDSSIAGGHYYYNVLIGR